MCRYYKDEINMKVRINIINIVFINYEGSALMIEKKSNRL